MRYKEIVIKNSGTLSEMIQITRPTGETFNVTVYDEDEYYFNTEGLPRHVLHLISDGDPKYRLGGRTTDGWQWKITMSKKLGIGV